MSIYDRKLICDEGSIYDRKLICDEGSITKKSGAVMKDPLLKRMFRPRECARFHFLHEELDRTLY